ncbi:MAG: signal peptidase I [Akkermansiaceae bacterium]|jgi:signal peptidase I|nr:signal peptidase I [Akkermansiaceae bacterium]
MKSKPFPKAAILCIILSLLIAAILLTGSLRLLRIPTSGMSPTLPPGTLVPAHRPLSRDFQRGEVVIFHPPSSPGSIYIQRIVAIPGDRIEVIDGVLHINNKPRISPEGKASKPAPVAPHLKFQFPSYPLTLPAGEYFMLGDNYDNSLDSRYFGTVSEDKIILVPFRRY